MAHITRLKRTYYSTKYTIEEIVAGIKLAWRNKWLVCTIALTIVVGVQEYGDILGDSVLEAVAYEELVVADKGTIHCDERCLMVAWLELRTEEILVESTGENRQRARYEAQLELNEMILEL